MAWCVATSTSGPKTIQYKKATTSTKMLKVFFIDNAMKWSTLCMSEKWSKTRFLINDAIRRATDTYRLLTAKRTQKNRLKSILLYFFIVWWNSYVRHTHLCLRDLPTIWLLSLLSTGQQYISFNTFSFELRIQTICVLNPTET